MRNARRRLGQNFLIDTGAIERIVTLLDPAADEPILEIGPGRGALTRVLLDRVERIAAIEIDVRLADALRERWPSERLLLIEGNVLDVELPDVLAGLGHPPPARLAVVGNLPYSISKPLAARLVRLRESIARCVLMFQREVAARITAHPGGRDYGPLTVLVGEAYRVRRCFDLQPKAFRPRPEIVSTVTCWEPRTDNPLGIEDERRLRACLAAAFGRRRKTLRNNLAAALGSDAEADRLLAACDIDGGLRAERVSPQQFRRMAARWPSAPG